MIRCPSCTCISNGTLTVQTGDRRRSSKEMKPYLLSLFTLVISASFALCQINGIEATPDRDWAAAPQEFLSARWDVEKLTEVKAHWELMREKRMSTALFVVDSGFVVPKLGDIEKPIKCHSVRKSLLNALFGVLHFKERLDLGMTMDDLGIDDITPLVTEEKKATIRP